MASITEKSEGETKIVFLITGAPGSGKSTLALKLSDNYLEADKFRGLYDEKGMIDKKNLYPAHKWCQKEFEKQVNENNFLPVVVSNTFSNLNDLKPYIDIIIKCKKSINVYILYPTFGLRYFDEEFKEESLQELRMIEARLQPPKVIPEEAVKNMIQQFKYNKSN